MRTTDNDIRILIAFFSAGKTAVCLIEVTLSNCVFDVERRAFRNHREPNEVLKECGENTSRQDYSDGQCSDRDFIERLKRS